MTAVRLKKGNPDYVNNKDFSAEIMKSKELGELTPEAVRCIMLIADRAIRKLYFEDKQDRDDCYQTAILHCLLYWKGFKSNVGAYPNAFAYFTQICKNGYAQGWHLLSRRGLKGCFDKCGVVSMTNINNL